MKVLAHLDPHVLERALLDRAAAALSAERYGRVVVLVPTTRLAEHVQRRAAARRAWLGLDVLHFRALLRRILQAAGAEEPRLLSPLLFQAMVRRLLAEQPHAPWARFAGARPGAVPRVTAALGELREAGVDPAVVSECAGTDRERDLARLYGRLSAELDRIAREGTVDEAGLVAAALPHAPAFARRTTAVLVHGVYELIGIHVELLRALDPHVALTVLLPARAGARVSEYAEAFARRHLLATGEELQAIDGGEPHRAARLAALYDERASPAPAAEGAFGFLHAQGAEAEVGAALRRALLAVHEGEPPGEILVVARSLTPFATAVEGVVHRERLAVSTSLCTSLRRRPVVHDLLRLLEVLRDRFPRQRTVEMLCSPRIRWTELRGVAHAPAGRIDVWSRKAGIVAGLDEWRELLRAWSERRRGPEDADHAERDGTAERRRRDCEAILGALEALDRTIPVDPPLSWAGHAARLGRMIDDLLALPEPDAEAELDLAGTLRGLAEEMAALETVVGDVRPVPFDEMVAWLDQAVSETELPMDGHAPGGLRLLDAMQARGITGRRLWLIGLNAGLLPRPRRVDPILPDGLRRRIRDATGRPLPLKADGASEERLLLALLVGSASGRVEVSWQRADEAGRARTPSLALRELCRLAFSRPEIELAVGRATHLPSHPEFRLAHHAARDRALTADEERLLAILRARRPGRTVRAWFPELGAGLGMLEATESFRSGDGRYDARVGPLGLPESFSVSALQLLANCPQQYFFRQVLGVRELDEEAGAYELEARHMGLDVHAVLQRVYEGLSREPAWRDHDEGALARRARELLDRAWAEVLGPLERRLARRVPELGRLHRRRWLGALGAFLDEDLARLARRGWPEIELERELRGRVALGEGVEIGLHGRLDRLEHGPQGVTVTDYKTGKVADLGDVTPMLKGERMQVGLYSRLAGEGARVEILGVGPRHDPRSAGEPDERRVVFRGFAGDEREGHDETLLVLVALAAAGRFPYRAGIWCDWCAFEAACRKGHPPTEARAEDDAECERYRKLATKSRSSPKLGLDPRASIAAAGDGGRR